MLSLENLRTVFGSSPEACLVLYPDAPHFTIAYANPMYLHATNRTADDIIGKAVFEAFPETQRQIARSSDLKISLQQALELKSAHKSSLFRFDVTEPISGATEPHFWICETYPLMNECGNIEYIVRSPKDVTQFVSEDAQGSHPANLLIHDVDNPLFQNHPDAVFTLDLNGYFLSVNRHLVEIAECSEAELLEMPFHPFIAEEDLELITVHFQKALSGEIQHFDATMTSTKGKRLALEITHLPIIINSDVVAIYGIAKDVTAIKTAEQQVEAYNQRISSILERVTDGFLAVDANFEITYWNKEAERILCKSRQDAMGKNLWLLYPQAVSQKFYSEYHRALSENISIQFQEYLDVVNCWLEVTAYPSEDGLSIFFKDISDRIQAEEELMQAKEQYQKLFDLSPVPNWIYDIETLAILDVNMAALEQYGYSREEFLSMTLKDVRPVEDVPGFLQIINKGVLPYMISTPSKERRSLGRHRKKSGEIINVEVKGSTISFRGQVARLVLIIDVTERLKSAQELLVSEQRFKALVQEGSDLIHIIDEHGFYKYVSPNTHRVLQWVFRVGDKAFSFVLEPDKQMVDETLGTLQHGECINLPPIRCRDLNNEIQWLEVTLTNLSEDPAVNGVVANSRNVTERINDALKIKESVEQYEIVSEATSDAIYEWNISANYLKWSKGFNVLFGHDPMLSKDVEGWSNMLHPDDKDGVWEQMNAIFQAKEPKLTLEYRFQCANGTYKHVLDRGYLIYNESGEPMRIIGAMQDVTDRISYIHSLEEKNKKLSEISWLQSHVVRAPLAQIMGLLELLSIEEPDEPRQRLLSHLRDSATELDQVVRDIIRKTEGV